jgi:hypothetical protein
LESAVLKSLFERGGAAVFAIAVAFALLVSWSASAHGSGASPAGAAHAEARATVQITGSAPTEDYTKDSRPQLFSYDELVALENQELSPELAHKLRVVTTTPFINNEAYYRGARPRPLDVQGLGPTLRVAFWNIERGLELDDIQLFLTDKERFMAKVAEDREHAKAGGKPVRNVSLEKIPQEIDILKSADVWILNEVDWGVKRTQYREVVRESPRRWT